jgi:hypothetical protein
MSECYLEVADEATVECDNCDWEGIGADLDMVSDIQERITPGFLVPAGECPDCGGLAYLTRPDRSTTQFRAEMVEKFAGIVRLFVDPTMKTANGDTRADMNCLRNDAARLLQQFDGKADAQDPH